MIALWLTLVLASPAAAPATFQHPVKVDSELLEIHGKIHEAVWTGHVVAVREQVHLTCDTLRAHYTEALQEITHLTCLGHVQVVAGDKWARGDKAEFDNVHGVLVVTGSPEARQGRNEIHGDKVTFYLAKDLLEVEHARAVFESRKGAPLLPGMKR